MKQILFSLSLLSSLYASAQLNETSGSSDTLINGSVTIITKKDKGSVTVITKKDKETTQGSAMYTIKDTIIIGNIIITNDQQDKKDTFPIPKNGRFSWSDSGGIHLKGNLFTQDEKNKNENITTNWLILDLGFTNLYDRTDYSQPSISGPNGYFPMGTAADLRLINDKSTSINVWAFMQRINLISHVVNLKYGLGVELNNYRYKKNIRFRDEPTDYIDRDAEVSVFEKNKLAADYVTVPVMLNFNFTPGKEKNYGLSAGVSAGYLFGARQKLVSKERGKEKIRNDFNLQPWKISAIAELNLGFVQLFGSYAITEMFRNGLRQTPYSAGLRFSNWD